MPGLGYHEHLIGRCTTKLLCDRVNSIAINAAGKQLLSLRTDLFTLYNTAVVSYKKLHANSHSTKGSTFIDHRTQTVRDQFSGPALKQIAKLCC